MKKVMHFVLDIFYNINDVKNCISKCNLGVPSPFAKIVIENILHFWQMVMETCN